MRDRARCPAALVALAILASALLGLIGEHAHAFGEIDRAPHSLVAIDHLPAAQSHLDRAVELVHPACGDCLLASLKSDGIEAPASGPGPVSTELVGAGADSTGPLHRPARRAPARAPPEP